jgi:hypothetical protein
MFWWNWWVNVAVAAGTIGAVLVALFGEAFRSKFFPPKLSLELANTNGEATRVQMGAGQEEARYYHVRVSNSRRWSPANEVQIVLLQVEEAGPNGNLQVVWRGDIPLGWRHQQLFPITRTIGGEAYADLCSIGEGRWLRLHLLLVPFNLQVVRNQPSTLVLTLQARGSEGDSSPLRIRIAWDGGWHQGEVEMRRHMSVETIT